MNLIPILKQILQEEKSKRDRCLRIADRKFDKPSAYKSGAVVRCRKGKIWKGIKEGEEQLNIQDLAYQQIPGLLEKGIEKELSFLSDIMDETLENTKTLTNPEIKRVPLKSIKPSQHGEDYENPSSEYTKKEFQKILNGEKNIEDHREGDLYPILVNRTTNEIIDGNHRHYALSAINSPYAVVLYVDVPTTPQFLYHATYKPLLKKIKEKGLDTNDSKKAWEDSIPGYVYLALDPYVAESYAEESEMVPEGWLDNIIILKIDTNKLDKSKLFTDQNVQDNEGDTLEYRGVIPWEALSLHKSEQLTEKQKETLRTWFKRKGAPGKTGGWVDCNSPIRKDGKITGYKPCGRQKGEIRSKYPSCRPTPSKCKDPGKGKKWGKTK